MPNMLLLSDIRQSVFQATLLSFWLVFLKEHMLIQDKDNKPTIWSYWRLLSVVCGCCGIMLLFDVWEHFVHLGNPFYLILNASWLQFALAFLGGSYFHFLLRLAWRTHLKLNALALLGHVIHRFNVLLIETLIIAAITLCAFAMGQVRICMSGDE